MKNHKNRVKYSDISVIQNGEEVLYDRNMNQCGRINIEKKDNDILCSINGSSVVINSEFHKTPVVLSPIDYKNIVFMIRKSMHENYYMYELDNSVVLIFKIRKESYEMISPKLYEYRKKNLFMLCQFDKNQYFDKLNFVNEGLELQDIFQNDDYESLYSCYFIQ
jgi:hypothetical protein